MKKRGIKSFIILFLVLIVPVIGYLLLKTGTNHYIALPIYGERYAEERMVDGKMQVDTVYHTIGDFSFTNQNGETVSSSLVEGKIKIVDFFFVDCKTICPKMSTQMKRIQEKVKTVDQIVLLSHTVNPESDSVPVLKRYAEEYGAINGKWHLLTGDKKELYRIAREGYMVNALQGDGGPDDFIHTELFVLVDHKNRIRGYYDGTSSTSVDTLIDEIKVLMKQEILGEKKRRR
jgi:protein SCO1